MTNRFGVDLHPKEVRWAAAEGVTEIAAVLLLHERSVEEIVPQLSPLELEKVIELVGRSPRLYPRGILEALDQHRSLTASALTPQSVLPSAAAREETKPSASAHPSRSDSRTGPDGRQSPTERAKRVERPSTPPETRRGTAAPCPFPRSGNRTVILGRRWSFGFRLITVSYISVGAGSVAVEARPALPNTDSTYNRGRQH